MTIFSIRNWGLYLRIALVGRNPNSFITAPINRRMCKSHGSHCFPTSQYCVKYHPDAITVIYETKSCKVK